MSIWSQTYQQSVFKRYHSDKYFSAFLPTRWWQKSTGMDMEQNYITVTLCISCTYHAYLNCHVQCGFSFSLSPPKVITDRYCCCLQAKCMNPRSADLNLKVQTVFWYGNHIFSYEVAEFWSSKRFESETGNSGTERRCEYYSERKISTSSSLLPVHRYSWI